MFFPDDAVRVAALSESVGRWVAVEAYARMLATNLHLYLDYATILDVSLSFNYLKLMPGRVKPFKCTFSYMP
jgi:hypothetical protein